MALSQNRPYTRIINFAGMDWYVRSGKGNPGNNLWNDDKQSVWVDNQNRLHLKIRYLNGKWYAAEIRSVHPTHYGKHIFYVANRTDLLDKNIVAAVFLYKNDRQEMDIEFSRWKHSNAPNTQYVVQPEKPTNLHKFNMVLNGNFSTHIIDWQPDNIHFESYYGHKIQLPAKDYLINHWDYNSKHLKYDNQYRIHINLWMVDNNPPSNFKEAELIIASIDTPVSPIRITGDVCTEISMYPNHYYDHIFIYNHFNNKTIRYKLIDEKNHILTQKIIRQKYFFIDLLEQPIGIYTLYLYINNKKYRYHIQKNY
jgi:hypothetical protein